jgi:hypothetical protein
MSAAPSGLTSRTSVRRIVVSRLDGVLVLVAFALGIPSLAFPFGSDQAIHYYVGREWILHGAIPYRDTFDYKTPGIFVIHALLIGLFGEQTWGIRLAELACTVTLGLLLARLVPARERGMTGFVCFATAVLYYGYFSYWDTAQCELWAMTFAIGSVVASRRWASAAGVLAGLAFLMKPPAVLLALPALVACARAPWRQKIAFVVGGVAPVAATLLYFQRHGAMPALAEVLVGADSQYVIGARRVSTPGELFEQLVDIVSWFQPFAALLVGGAVAAVATKRGAGLPRMPLVIGALALTAIVVQLKFYRYHYALLVPAIVLALAHVASTIARLTIARAAAVVIVLYSFAGTASRNWLLEQRASLGFITGTLTRAEMANRFANPWLLYDERAVEDVGIWLRAHTMDNEAVMVRGFQPGVYVFAHRRAPGRFFWTTPLIDPKRQFHRAEWLAEDERALATRPRFIVAHRDAQGPDALARFTTVGYTRCREFGKLTVLTREPSACDVVQ